MTFNKNLLAVFALSAVLVFSPLAAANVSAAPIAANAATVIGQTDLTSNVITPAGSVNADTLAKPQKIVYDAQSNLWVADTDNNRVLKFNADPTTKEIVDTTADMVIGQPDFVTTTPGVSAIKLDKPVAIAFDSNENLYIVDENNNRVVVLKSDPVTQQLVDTTADVVIGQVDLVSKAVVAPSAVSLNQPAAIEIVKIIDPTTQAVTAEKVIVADRANHRVLVIDQNEIAAAITTPSDVVTAEFVIGQNSLNENTVNLGGITAATLNSPVALATAEVIDPTTQNVVDQKLVIADRDNHRVLVQDLPIVANAPIAEKVIGQADITVANVVLPPTASSLNVPTALAVDNVNERLLVADSADNRIMVYSLNEIVTPQITAQAIQVIGQTDFVSNEVLPVASDTVRAPLGIAVDPVTKKVAIADTDNNRIVIVPEIAPQFVSGQIPTLVIGQPDMQTISAPISVNAGELDTPRDVVVAQNGDVYVADSDNNRVLVFQTPVDVNAPVADFVIGQPNKVTNVAEADAQSLNTPIGIILDEVSNQLYVADAFNNRVLVFQTPITADEPIAQFVLGQPTMLVNTVQPVAADTLNLPTDVAVDPVAKKLVVADSQNSRLMVYDLPITQNAQPAVQVLGQPDMVSNTVPTVAADTLNHPVAVAIDKVNNNVLVADRDNNRVVAYDLADIVATTPVNQPVAVKVLGQPDMVSNTVLPVAADTLNHPVAVEVDQATGHILIADRDNNRVVEHAPIVKNGQEALAVIGQADFVTAAIAADNLVAPVGIAVDQNSNLWVADRDHDRVLKYVPVIPTPPEPNVITTTVTIVDTPFCGVKVVTPSMNYGQLQAGVTSQETQLVVENTGNIAAELRVHATNWVDSANNVVISAADTKFSTTQGADFATQMTPADATTDKVVDSAFSANTPLDTFWKMQANLLNQQFTGSLSQTIEFTAVC